MVHTIGVVVKWYPTLSFSNRLSSGYGNMMNRLGLGCPFGLCLYLFVWVVWFRSGLPVKDVMKLYMLPTTSTMSWGNPRSFIRAKSLGWFNETKCILKVDVGKVYGL